MKIFKRIYYLLIFFGYYGYKLIEANLFIAFDILTPKMYNKPGVLTAKIKLKSKTGMLILNNLISMTPGTLSIDLSPENKTIDVHFLYLKDKEKELAEIEKMENIIKNILE